MMARRWLKVLAVTSCCPVVSRRGPRLHYQRHIPCWCIQIKVHVLERVSEACDRVLIGSECLRAAREFSFGIQPRRDREVDRVGLLADDELR